MLYIGEEVAPATRQRWTLALDPLEGTRFVPREPAEFAAVICHRGKGPGLLTRLSPIWKKVAIGPGYPPIRCRFEQTATENMSCCGKGQGRVRCAGDGPVFSTGTALSCADD